MMDYQIDITVKEYLKQGENYLVTFKGSLFEIPCNSFRFICSSIDEGLSWLNLEEIESINTIRVKRYEA